MKKTKRFNEGGYTETDDYKNLVSAQEREDVEAIGDKFAKTLKKDEAAQEAPKKQSFGEAFKAARKAGGKTFEWNGKKYTTETADEKSTFKPRTAFQKRADKQAAMRSERAKAGYKAGGVVKSSASKRADGIATKGKTKGRIV